MYDSEVIASFAADGITLPTKFEVCPTCQGRGQHSQNLGTFSAEEMDEYGDEFREDYIAGRYDSRCETCKGQRVVTVLDRNAVTEAVLAQFDRDVRELAEMDAISESERRMGA